MAGIKGNRYRPQNERLHRERTTFQPLKPYYNGTGEAEVVPGYQLANALRAWIDQWRRERPINENQNDRFMGAIEYIHFHSRIDKRRIHGLVKCEFPVVGQQQAEEVLKAIGRLHLLSTGEIQVVPNPNWSLEKWVGYMEDRGCI